ncbi:MAG: ABC transporter permease subunit, partial [Verrucomicrobiota bacterium]
MTRAFYVQFKRELGALLLSPIAYILFVVFGLVTFTAFSSYVGDVLQGPVQQGVMERFFSSWGYWICTIIVVPIITMRLFAEEFRSGTIEMLMTAPIREVDVVMAKFCAAVVIYCFLWLPTVFYYAAFQFVSGSAIPVQWSALSMAYLMVVLIGMFYVSIGLFASSLTKNQIVA